MLDYWGGLGWLLQEMSSLEISEAPAQDAQGVGGSLSLAVFQSCGDVALRNVGSGHGGGGLGWDWGAWRAFPT